MKAQTLLTSRLYLVIEGGLDTRIAANEFYQNIVPEKNRKVTHKAIDHTMINAILHPKILHALYLRGDVLWK